MVKSYTLALTGWRNTTWLHAMWSQTLQWNSAIGRYVDLNTLKPRHYGRHFPDDLFKCIFLNENVWISLTISLKFVPKVTINNIPTLVQIMAWRRPGDKPLSEPMMVGLPTHIGLNELTYWARRKMSYMLLMAFLYLFVMWKRLYSYLIVICSYGPN